MDRRDFLRGVVATGVGGAAAAPAAAAAARLAWPAPSGVSEMEAFLARWDAGMAAIDAGQGDLGDLEPTARGAEAEEGRALFRRSVRALHAVGSFGALSPADQLHPGVQARLHRELPLLAEVVEAHERRLAAMRPADHAALQAALVRRPDLPVALAGALDDAARSAGLGDSRRGKLRAAAIELGARLRTQPPSLLVGEYLDKVRRAGEHAAPEDAYERLLAARLGEPAFWAYREHVERERAAWAERLGAAGDGPERRSSRTARRAAYILGIGVGVGGVCAALMTAEFGFVFGVTVGVVLVLVGLITLLVAGLQRASEDDAPRGPAEAGSDEPAAPHRPEPPRAGGAAGSSS